MKIKFLNYLTLLAALLIAMPSCSSDKDEPQEEAVKAECNFSFTYDRNMLFSNQFDKEVSSVAVWAFNKNGKLVWSHTETAEDAFNKNYTVTANLPVGEYDIVAWCGKTTNIPLLPTSTPNSLSQLSLSVPTIGNVCNMALPTVFNAYSSNFTVAEDAANNLELSLTCATKKIRVLMESTETPIDKDNYEMWISGAPNKLDWNMTPQSTATFDYQPYYISDSSVETEEMGIYVFVADFSTLCFDANSQATLVIKDKKTNKEIVNTLLVPALVQNKPFEIESISDQEYLDRQNNYYITYFLK